MLFVTCTCRTSLLANSLHIVGGSGSAFHIVPFQVTLSNKYTDDCDSLLSLMAKCHDGHQALLLQEEEKLHNSVHEWATDYLDTFRQKERERNRTRVLELNFFLDTVKREVDELEVLPQHQNQYDDEM